LTRVPIHIPFSRILDVKTGNSHAGRMSFGQHAIKIVWENQGVRLSSGFILARDQQETEKILTDLKRRSESSS
jgi:hypothetical protein